ncbi:hypothetical protein WME75_38635 [Sorangium sp. So ce1014]|uniref:hypothetical protein n=1 Tax=Sorangium sp. So ce1014 TaxID=3133326 RepID=UPI003F646177
MNVDDVYEQHVRGLPLADRLRLAERIVAQAAVEAQGSSHAIDVSAGGEALGTLGSRLRAIRARIERSGEPLLDEAGVRQELAERRGGIAALELGGDAHLR